MGEGFSRPANTPSVSKVQSTDIRERDGRGRGLVAPSGDSSSEQSTNYRLGGQVSITWTGSLSSPLFSSSSVPHLSPSSNDPNSAHTSSIVRFKGRTSSFSRLERLFLPVLFPPFLSVSGVWYRCDTSVKLNSPARKCEKLGNNVHVCI